MYTKSMTITLRAACAGVFPVTGEAFSTCARCSLRDARRLTVTTWSPDAESCRQWGEGIGDVATDGRDSPWTLAKVTATAPYQQLLPRSQVTSLPSKEEFSFFLFFFQ